MPNQTPQPVVQNNFKAGLKTEFTGLNFPENAATDTQNCVYTLIGDTNRRGGINYEAGFEFNNIGQVSVAQSSYKWNNVGGDGNTKALVKQVGSKLYFYISTNATLTNPLSTTQIASIINIANFQAAGNTNNAAISEVQYSDGNGYLFIFHKDCDPFYCTFNSNTQTVTANIITLQIRDFVGIPEPGVADNFRPLTLSPEHNYNLLNQGWTAGVPWTAIANNPPSSGGGGVGASVTYTITSQTNTTSIVNGSEINISAAGAVIATISVTSYVTPFTSITGTILSGNTGAGGVPNVSLSLINVGFINTWFTKVGNYPSNSDVWWLYKDTTDVFNPTLLLPNVQQAFGPAPKGYFIMNAFRQQRSTVSGVTGLTDIITNTRPSTGAFYAGRVFYAGVNASDQAAGDAPFTTWTENIYFSQIIESPVNFARCYQTNDPTSQNTFSLLPSDGGVINIQGCGGIYKLFALRFGLLVFAANGVWFVSGSTGIGFTASDYTVIKISSIQTLSGTSFIDVMGYPYYFNQEGIYRVTPSQQPGSAHSPDIQLDVQNLTVGTILTYYQNFPLQSVQFARGDYDQINYVIQWVIRSTAESGIANRYAYDTVISFNTVTQAFYPYTLPTTSASTICDIKYIQNIPGSGVPEPVFKYITLVGANLTFSEENDFTRYVDFFNENNAGFNFLSYFTTGYNLPGQGLRKIQTPYVYVFSRNPGINAYGIRSIWDFAGSPVLGTVDTKSGKWSTRQVITNNSTDYTMVYRKIRLRGRGLAVQIRVDSQPGQPFDIMGWSVWNEVNPGI